MFKNPRKILVIDDDEELATLFVDYLTLEGFLTSAALSGEEGLEAASRESFDLIVLAETMPAPDGLEVLRRLRRNSQVPVLMLTSRGDSADRIHSLELGADDYVRKPCPPRELVARINAILRRSSSARAVASPVSVGPVTIDPAQRTVMSGTRPIELTSTEFSLFELLARNAGTPVCKEDIYPKVLGRPMGPYDRAIDVHVSSIRHKIAAVIGRSLVIESIRGVGYQLVVRSDAPEAM